MGQYLNPGNTLFAKIYGNRNNGGLKIAEAHSEAASILAYTDENAL